MDIHVAAIVADVDDVMLVAGFNERDLIDKLISHYDDSSCSEEQAMELILSQNLDTIIAAFREEFDWTVSVQQIVL